MRKGTPTGRKYANHFVSAVLHMAEDTPMSLRSI